MKVLKLAGGWEEKLSRSHLSLRRHGLAVEGRLWWAQAGIQSSGGSETRRQQPSSTQMVRAHSQLVNGMERITLWYWHQRGRDEERRGELYGTETTGEEMRRGEENSMVLTPEGKRWGEENSMVLTPAGSVMLFKFYFILFIISVKYLNLLILSLILGTFETVIYWLVSVLIRRKSLLRFMAPLFTLWYDNLVWRLHSRFQTNKTDLIFLFIADDAADLGGLIFCSQAWSL